MTLHRFYVKHELRPDAEGRLDDDRARQVNRVLRMVPGDEIVLFDGSGVEARAEIIESSRRAVRYRVTGIDRPEREPALWIRAGVPLLRGDRLDLAVQKLTELGVAEIVPLRSERSVVSYPDARDWARREARLRRIAIEAAEQSERVTIPQLFAPVELTEFLEAEPTFALVERGACESLGSVAPRDRWSFAVGPEGGWSPRELDIIESKAAGQLSLGNLILRAETAAIVAAGTIIQRWWANLRKVEK